MRLTRRSFRLSALSSVLRFLAVAETTPCVWSRRSRRPSRLFTSYIATPRGSPIFSRDLCSLRHSSIGRKPYLRRAHRTLGPLIMSSFSPNPRTTVRVAVCSRIDFFQATPTYILLQTVGHGTPSSEDAGAVASQTLSSTTLRTVQTRTTN